MKQIKFIVILVFAFFMGCASKPTAQERISNVGQTYKETGKQIDAARKDLSAFEQSFSKLRDTAAASKTEESKGAFEDTLTQINSRLQRTRSDLEELKASNERGQAEYQRQLEEAANRIQKSSEKNRAE